MFKSEELLERLLCFFFPNRCIFCGKVLPPMSLECNGCQTTVKRISEPVCILCGCEKKDCCCKKRRYFHKGIVAPLYYEDKVRRAFKIFKFQDNTVAARLLGEMMAGTAKKYYANIKFDVITYVPMTRKKLRQRGYNQSELLAKETAKHLQLKVEGTLLSKIYENDIQHDLNSYLRSGNIIGVYDVPEPELIKGKTILLCDDIKTTGETLNECAKMLILNGASEVWCLVGALTRRRRAGSKIGD